MKLGGIAELRVLLSAAGLRIRHPANRLTVIT